MSKVDIQSIVKFEKDRDYLKVFIEKNFNDADLINYELENRDLLQFSGGQLNKKMSDKEIDRKFAKDSQRVWRFLSNSVIFREASRNPNKH